MQAHYTSILDLSQDALEAAEKGYQRLMESIHAVSALKGNGNTSNFDLGAWVDRCYAAMNDDFNTPVLIAQLFEAVKQVNLLKEGQTNLTDTDVQLLSQTLKTFTFEVLGLRDESKIDTSHFEKLSSVIELLIEQRNKARERRDFSTSDQIRDQLLDLGIQLKDSKDGTTFSIS
jgi:Cysteinyl-tRNA synthetase